MNIVLWLTTNWHWLIIVGTGLAILGTLYGAYSYLNFKLLNGLTRSFTFGIVGGIVVVVALEISIFITGLFNLLFSRSLLIAISTYFVTAVSILPLGLTFGVLIGFIVGFVSSQAQKTSSTPKRVSWMKYSLLILFGLLLVVWTIENYQDTRQINFISGSIELTYGFVVGMTLDPIKIDWRKLTIWLATSIIVVILLFKFSIIPLSDRPIYFLLASYLIPYLFCGLMVGLMLNQSFDFSTSIKLASWKKYFLWLAIGFIYEIALSIIYRTISNNQKTLAIDVIGSIVIITSTFVGIGGGEGDKLIRKRKPYYRYVIKQNLLQPLINWPRFITGSLVGFFDVLFFFWMVFIAFIGIFFPSYILFSPQTFLYSLQEIIGQIGLVILPLGLAVSLIVGSVYGFSPVIIFDVEKLSERRMGQIGIGLTAIGIVVAALPSLMS